MKLDDIEYLGIDKVIKRNTAEIIKEDDDGIFVYDKKSETYMIACDDTQKGIRWFEECAKEYDLINVCGNDELADILYKKYNKKYCMKCYQVAYMKKEPFILDDVNNIRCANYDDAEFLYQNYHFSTPDEVKECIDHNPMFIIEYNGDRAGFIGEHYEGSMGMLFIKEEYRKLGLATALEKYLINYTLKEGYIPFGQIIYDNYKSFNLQNKLGLDISKKFVYWIF